MLLISLVYISINKRNQLTGYDMSLKNILANPKTHDQLDELVKKRVAEFSPIKTKQAIVAQAVEGLFKKEIKK